MDKCDILPLRARRRGVRATNWTPRCVIVAGLWTSVEVNNFQTLCSQICLALVHPIIDSSTMPRDLDSVEVVLANKLSADYHKQWCLVGWKLVRGKSRSSMYQIIILVERVSL